MNRFLLLTFCLLLLYASRAEEDSTAVFARRKKAFAITSSALTTGSLFYLNAAWYSDYNTGKFHFFQDADEWQQMDKAGHFFTTYQMARLMMGSMQNCRFEERKAFWWGGLIGFGYMAAIEVMDGFSKGWGFSTSDMLANVAGTSLAMLQQHVWHHQKLLLKYSYYKSGLANYNPNLLGDAPMTQILKDYNGQKYWLTVSPFAFSEKYKKWRWMCISLGYGAKGMINATVNTKPVFDNAGNLMVFERYRVGYLSVDIDLSSLPVKKPWLKKTLSMLNMLKVPFPAVSFSRFGTKFNPFLY